MEKTKTTKFYIPNSGTPFQLTKFEALELSDVFKFSSFEFSFHVYTFQTLNINSMK